MGKQTDSPLPFSVVAPRALGLLALGGLSLGATLGSVLRRGPLETYIGRNQISSGDRNFLLQWMLGSAIAATVAGAAWLWTHRRQSESGQRLYEIACRISPMYFIGFLPSLFQWRTWRDQPLTFLVLAVLFSLGLWGALRVAQRMPALAPEARLRDWAAPQLDRIKQRCPRMVERLPLVIVIAASCAYVLYFSYYTICYHYSVRSGYDLGIKNNLFWNTLHGRGFFKASITLGPSGSSHFGRHADLLLYFLLPFYYLYQRPETLLVLQSLFIGAAAIPLFLLAQRHIGNWGATVLAVTYLLHPAMHGANLFEFHFLPLGPFFLWLAWLLLERRRDVWAGVFVALTLFTREDVALWVAFLGAYLAISGERPRAGMVVGAVGTAYFLAIKFWIMPAFSGEESFSFIYDGLTPQGERGFFSVLKTVVGNPVFTLSTLLTEAKLVYLLQILVPLAFLPFRRAIWLLLAIPGFLLTVLSPKYGPVYSIHFQYSPHWIAFMYPAVALGLASLARRAHNSVHAQAPALIALVCAAIPVSYQFGAVFQQNTSVGGPSPYVFGIDETARQRHEAVVDLNQLIPQESKVACSALTAPQYSSREDAYDMNQGFWDADYLVFPTEPSQFIVNEKRDVSSRLSSGEFGVVKVHPPFALAKRGHPTSLNESLLTRWR